MKFTKYEGSIPRTAKKDLRSFFEEFINANIEIAVVEFKDCDYKSPAVATECIRNACKRHGYPITVVKRGDSVYLIRRDM